MADLSQRDEELKAEYAQLRERHQELLQSLGKEVYRRSFADERLRHDFGDLCDQVAAVEQRGNQIRAEHAALKQAMHAQGALPQSPAEPAQGAHAGGR